MALLDFEHLTFTYASGGRPALRDVSLRIEAGEYVVVAGASGCGKTTLLRQLKPALVPAGQREGIVRIDGIPVGDLPMREQARRIGFVLQDPDDQIVCDTVEAELAFGLENVGCDRASMGVRVAEAASFFGVQEWLHRPVSELSGGQKQLLNLAAVMALEPDVLVLDEPTSQLDPIAAEAFLGMVRRVHRELGVTVIAAEHRLEEVLADADRLVVMDAGRIAADGDGRAVAVRLCAERGPISAALPVAVQAYEGVRRAAPDGLVPMAPVPLTVREGRLWLRRQLADVPRQVELPTASSAPTAPDAPARTAFAKEDRAEALVMRDVRFRYRRDAPDVLCGLSLQVGAGSLCALVGGNGAGKSTVLKAACGWARPYQGSVSVFGQKLARGVRAADLGVALLPQGPTMLFACNTVGEELRETGATIAQCQDMMARCQVEGLGDAHPLDLSGGERQRVALAKVLLGKPRLLLLDEPSKGLDAAAKATLGEQLGELAASGIAVLLVSHDLEFCARYAHEVALLFNGAVASSGAPRDFFARNSFYTTAANRMARDRIPDALTPEDVVRVCVEGEGACEVPVR